MPPKFLGAQIEVNHLLLFFDLRVCRLGLESLQETIQEKYERILLHFGRDIETIQKLYQRHRNDPPVAWDLPPIAGKIAWSRQMYRRIQEPMDLFQKYPAILHGSEAKKIIKNYNKLAKVLLEFELLYHQAWIKQVIRFFWNLCVIEGTFQLSSVSN